MSEKQQAPEPSRPFAEDLNSAERPLRINVRLDQGKEYLRVRQRWWELWAPSGTAPPAPQSLDDAKVVPLVHASLLSKLTYSWISPMMTLGYRRTLQATDLWKVDSSQECALLSEKLDNAWSARTKAANEWNAELATGTRNPGVWLRVKWFLLSLTAWNACAKKRVAYETHWRATGGKKSPSLAWALNDVFGWSFWVGGLFKVLGDVCQMMGPILVREIIIFARKRANARAQGQPLAHPGAGIAMACGCFILVIVSSLCLHQFFWRSMSTGVLARAALINSIYKRAVTGTPKSRSQFDNAQVVGFVSTDVSRIEYATQWFHAAWTAPIQVTVCLIILLVQLGPSALAGFSIFFFIAPIQERSMARQFAVRMKANVFTDQRARLLMEVISSMRIVKYFCYEKPFLQRIFDTRRNELRGINKIQLMRSANIAFAFSTPVLAATLAFLTYTLTNNEFDVAIIFSSLSLFNLLRQPMMMLPAALSAASDARSALHRLTPFFAAETRQQEAFRVENGQEEAILVSNASFQWEKSDPPDAPSSKSGKRTSKPIPQSPPSGPPFCVRDVSLAIPRGYLVGIVGAVGSGKSSLLQGLIGEMRSTKGGVCFGGRVAYCSQTAWIQNATIRANILFGRRYDKVRYSRVLELSCLLPDLAIFPAGDATEIGERGVNLSGGQRQRVNIARALYYDAEVVILDDPLSAVDAHVGKALFNTAILGYLRSRGKTVLLVTHALYLLSHCDLICMMEAGRITERGAFDELISYGGEFAHLYEQFGGETLDQDTRDGSSTPFSSPSSVPPQFDGEKEIGCSPVKTAVDTEAGKQVNQERRVTGSVSWEVYAQYLTAGKGFVTGPTAFATGLLMQCSQILNTYTLVWWQANTWNRPVSFYQTLFGCLGVLQAILTFALGAAMGHMSMAVSQNMHHAAMMNLFHATMTYFDTTPLGRILSVFGKDIDVLDNQLPGTMTLLFIHGQLLIVMRVVSMRMVTLTLSNLLGAVIIISILLPFFLIAVVGVAVLYIYLLNFYGASAREIKRLDAALRSTLYAHLSESLTGLPTVRSYRELPWFIRSNQYYIDLESRARILAVTTQRWLAVRIELMGAFMVFSAALLAVMGISGVTPAQVGLILTYTTTLAQLCSMVTRQSADVENHMNSVERVAEYSRAGFITQERPHELARPQVPSNWPARGEIEMRNVVMRYRDGLPNVLCGVSLYIKGGERIGVVGRTGAGKSSLTLALTRIVELAAGSILIDKVDIATLGIRTLRGAISIIPQEPLLFSGTVRSNLDPFFLYDDARLWSALDRSFLVNDTPACGSVESGNNGTEGSPAITLDSRVESEGLNLSVGQRSLLSLARALVQDTRIVILDEATASVDLATDSLIQATISSQFSDRTLICIAHRLRTILSYDRILVMDSGNIAEFDTPLKLFQQNGIFRRMCDGSNISLKDIEHPQSSVQPI